MGRVEVFTVIEEDAEEFKRKRVHKVGDDVRSWFANGTMERTLPAIMTPPALGEPEGNCHNIALAFMTDLMISRLAKGWSWVKGINPDRKSEDGQPWEHSWLEYQGYAIDPTVKPKDKPEVCGVSIGDAEWYYKARGITKILKRRDAKQTRKYIFKKSRKGEK